MGKIDKKMDDKYIYLVNERQRGASYIQTLLMVIVLSVMLYVGFIEENFNNFGIGVIVSVVFFYIIKDKFIGIKFNKKEIVILTFSDHKVYSIAEFKTIKAISAKRGTYLILFNNGDSYIFYFRDIEDVMDVFELNNVDSHKMAKRIEGKIRGIIPHRPL
jgi:hypothetical protein